jgi:hypothetical protein
MPPLATDWHDGQIKIFVIPGHRKAMSYDVQLHI